MKMYLYIITAVYNDFYGPEDALNNLDNDICLFLNDDQPISSHISTFLQENPKILEYLHISVPSEEHVSTLWNMLPDTQKNYIFECVIG
jgi:hypothetical protein